MKLICSPVIILCSITLLSACHSINKTRCPDTDAHACQQMNPGTTAHRGGMATADSFHRQAHQVSNYSKRKYTQQYKNGQVISDNSLSGNEFTYPGINFGDMLRQ